MTTERLSIHDAADLPAAHEHAWVTESAHRTSEGVILYVACAVCAHRRVDRVGESGVPTAASTIVRAQAASTTSSSVDLSSGTEAPSSGPIAANSASRSSADSSA